MIWIAHLASFKNGGGQRFLIVSCEDKERILLTNKEKVSLSFSTMALIPLEVGVDVELVDGLWLVVDVGG